MTERAVTPVVGIALLLVVTAVLAGTLVLAVDRAPSEPPPSAAFDATADAGTDRIAVTHLSGDAVDTRSVEIEVTVDGTPLARQPPVPFFAADGFRSGPTGPFNPAGGTTWRAGTTASFRLATTNAPRIDPGDRIRIRVYAGDALVGAASTTA